MHPGFIHWWQQRERRRGAGCGSSAGWGAEAEAWFGPRWHGPHEAGDVESGLPAGFGVRRPLRFLAYKLDLNDEQVAELAAILDELKIERAQAAVDQRRTTSALADALSRHDFDAARAAEAGEGRLKSAERLRDAVIRALGRIHKALDDEQRKKLATLIRTGILTI